MPQPLLPLLLQQLQARAAAAATATTAASVGVKTPNFMPPMMSSGSSKAHTPRTRACRTRRTSKRCTCTGGASRRAHHHQVAHSAMPIKMPGTMPARKSLVMDTCAATPKTTKPMDGGMMGAMMPPAAISPEERPTS